MKIKVKKINSFFLDDVLDLVEERRNERLKEFRNKEDKRRTKKWRKQ